MVSKNEPGFPPRGNTLYVFSIDGMSNSSGTTMIDTDAAGGATQPDASDTPHR